MAVERYSPRFAWGTLVDMLRERARLSPQACALTSLSGRTTTSLAYRELWQRARVAAAALRERGIANGERVAIIVADAVDFAPTYFGVLLAGGIPVPLAPPSSTRASDLANYDAAIDNFVRDAGTALCVVDAPLQLLMRDHLHRVAPGVDVISPRLGGVALAERELAVVEPHDVGLLQYTSGSTSRPKGVVLTHANLLSNIAAIESVLQGRLEDVTVTWLPLFHDMGLIGGLLTSIYAQVPVVAMTPQSFVKHPAQWLRAISDHRGTITVAPNFAFGYCLSRITDAELAELDLSSLRVILNGAEPVDVQLVQRFEERFAVAGLKTGTIMPVYGLAESCLAVAFADSTQRIVDIVDAAALETDGLVRPCGEGGRVRRLVSVGRALPSQQICVVDERDEPVPERSVGEICVRGPSVMARYYGKPEETRAALQGGWLHTGDLGYLADGNLFVVGRKKDMFILRGRNYYPEDLEFHVHRLPGIRKGCVAAFAVEGHDGVVIAAETRLRDAAALAVLKRCVIETVSAKHALRVDDVVLLPAGALPKSSSGKIQRRRCLQHYLDKTLGLRRPAPRGQTALRVVRSAALMARRHLRWAWA